MPSDLANKIFRQVLQNAKDVTDTFDIDLGRLPEDIVESHQQAEPYIQQVREIMDGAILNPDTDLSSINFGLVDMKAWAKVYGAHIKEALQSGDVVAIDGTPLVPYQRFLVSQVYACAIGTLTYREHMSIKAQVVKTRARQGLFIDKAETERFINETENLSSSQSWPSAFMEYLERQAARDHPAQYALIDGPFITQNLLTREEGRKLYGTMLGAKRKCYVGVIKDIRFAHAEERFAAAALRTGELFVRDTEYNILKARLDKDYSATVKRFGEDYLTDILRGIFKPGRETFGFQCHRQDLPAAICLLSMDANTQPGHEIPFLLEQVDAQLRGRYRPQETMAAVEFAIAGDNIDEFYDEAEERKFRS
jgi:NurA domain